MRDTNKVVYEWKPQVGNGFGNDNNQVFKDILSLNFGKFFEKKEAIWKNYSRSAEVSSTITTCDINQKDDKRTLNFKLITTFNSSYATEKFSKGFLPPYQDYCSVLVIGDDLPQYNSWKNENKKNIVKKKNKGATTECRIGGEFKITTDNVSTGLGSYNYKKEEPIEEITNNNEDMNIIDEYKEGGINRIAKMKNTYHPKNDQPNNQGYSISNPGAFMLRSNGYLHTTNRLNKPVDLAIAGLNIAHEYSVELDEKKTISN